MAETNLKKLAEDLKPFLTSTASKNKGGQETMSDFCPECMKKDQQAELAKRDHQHDLEKLTAERDLAKQQSESTNAEFAAALKSLQYHIEHYPGGCHDGENCSMNQALHRIAQEAKKNITSDDLTVDMVGEFFKKRGILGVAKTESGGPYKPFGSIKM